MTEPEKQFTRSPDRPHALKPMRRTTSELTVAQRQLVQVMHEYQFGRLENILVHAGQPLLDEMKIVRVVRLGGEDAGTRVPCSDEFQLKQAVCDLLDELALIEDGTVLRLEFKRGLPCLLETTTAPRLERLSMAPEIEKPVP
jgi:hypothetical protein